MFTVYGISGREFSGTLEQMRQLAPVGPASFAPGEGGYLTGTVRRRSRSRRAARGGP